ncbi:MAG: hypothetical protein JWM10_5437 [Myxococcaceae bacterium]|nr:hypothetical protein [Myxococcaceae bacterium]
MHCHRPAALDYLSAPSASSPLRLIGIRGLIASMSPSRRARSLALVLAAASLAGCRSESPFRGYDASITDSFFVVNDLSRAVDVVAIVDTHPADLPGRDASVAPDAPAADASSDEVMPFAFPVDPTAVPPPGRECMGADAGIRMGDASIDPPRPVIPQSVSRVTSQRPTFRWILPAGTTGAHVEACADRCCTRVLGSYDADGTSVRPERGFPPGMVYWRMFGRRGGSVGARASATWEFEVRRRDTPVDSSWGTIRDFNGDGYDDLVELVMPRTGPVTTQVMFVAGGATGPAAARNMGETIGEPSLWSELGDFNGDGLADLLFTTIIGGPGPIEVLEGTSDGVRHARTIDPSMLVPHAIIEIATVTDWNGDGYSDLVGSINFEWHGTTSSVTGSRLAVWAGSPSGLAAVPQAVEVLPVRDDLPYQNAWHGLADMDMDGFGDVLLTRERIDVGEGVDIMAGGAADNSVHGREVIFDSYHHLSVLLACTLGDYDGDGILDSAMTPLSSWPRVDHGVPGTYFGRIPTVQLRDVLYDAASSMLDVTWGLNLGRSMAFGDLDGDGYADLLVSSAGSFSRALNRRTPFNTGRMFVYRGSLGGLATDPLWIGRPAPSDGSNPQGFASAIAAPGDLNGDGIDDAAIFDPGTQTVCYVLGDVGIHTADATRCVSVGSGPRSDVYLP